MAHHYIYMHAITSLQNATCTIQQGFPKSIQFMQCSIVILFCYGSIVQSCRTAVSVYCTWMRCRKMLQKCYPLQHYLDHPLAKRLFTALMQCFSFQSQYVGLKRGIKIKKKKKECHRRIILKFTCSSGSTDFISWQ